MAERTVTLPDIDDLLEKANQEVSGMSFEKPLKEIRQLVIGATGDNFDNETAPDGYKWEALRHPRSRKRDKRPKRKGRSDKILQDSGNMKASVTARGAIGNIDELTESTLEWGTNIEHAEFHDTGTMNFRGKTAYGVPPGVKKPPGMVKREFLGITDDLKDKFSEVIAEHVAKTLEGMF